MPDRLSAPHGWKVAFGLDWYPFNKFVEAAMGQKTVTLEDFL